MSDVVARIDAWRCPVPMPRELHLGAITYPVREYVVLRMTTKDGVTGAAVGYTRGVPVFESLRILAEHVLEAQSMSPERVISLLRHRFAPGWGAVVRAASLIDIALWDMRARTSGVSLDAVFGGTTQNVPLMAVAGYYLDQRGLGPIVDEVRRFVDEGYFTIKLIVPGHDLAADKTLVSQVAEVLPPGVDLAIDFHGAFDDVIGAAAYCRAFDDIGLRFIEDPFPSHEVPSVIALAGELLTPIAAGEDVMTSSVLDQLVDGGVGYLRVDATASGGYTEIIRAVTHATAAGAIVAPHVWPHIHHPLAASSPTIKMIEIIPHYVGADPIDLLLSQPFPIVEGRWKAPEQPGLYLPVDWERVARHAADHWTTG